MQPVAVAVVPDLGQKPDPTELRRSSVVYHLANENDTQAFC